MKSSLIILSALVLLLSNPMYSQTAADTISIKKRLGLGTFSYQQNGKLLNKNQVAQVLKTNSLAYNDFIRAQTMIQIARGLGWIGSIVATIGLGTIQTSLFIGAIGVTIMAIPIPLLISSGKKIELAILRYNQGLLKGFN